MKRLCVLLGLFIFSLLFFGMPLLYGDSALGKYKEAVRHAKQKKYDFAFMEFRDVIKRYPESEYAKEALFAIGEYYYIQRAYYDAFDTFNEYTKTYPDSDGAVFAKAYLIEIMEGIEKPPERNRGIVAAIKENFFSAPLFITFSEYKEVSYESGFRNIFTARYYLDKIEIYRNGEIFLEITQ